MTFSQLYAKKESQTLFLFTVAIFYEKAGKYRISKNIFDDLFIILTIEMQPSHRLQNYRKEIRRDHLDSIFSARRIKLIEGLSKNNSTVQGMDVQKQEINLQNINKEQISVAQLQAVAKLSQSKEGIEIIHKSQVQTFLYPFLTQKHSDSDEQYYASYILCNIYYQPISAPSQILTQSIAHLLDQANMKTLQNVFFLLNNVISNYQSWLNVLINNYSLIEKLSVLFKRFQKPTISFLIYLLQIVFKCLRLCKDQRFLKLKVPLTKLVMQKQSEEMKELIKKASYCYYYLVRYFSNDMSQSLVKFGALNKLIEMTGFFSEKKYTHMILEMIEFVLNEITETMIQNIIMPYLINLAIVGFDLGDKSNIFPPRQIKLQAYRIVRLMFQSYKLKVEYFGSCKLGEIMMDQFQTSQDKQLLVVLSYVFVQVYLNSQNQQLKGIILQLIKRAQDQNKDDFAFAAYLHEFTNPI